MTQISSVPEKIFDVIVANLKTSDGSKVGVTTEGIVSAISIFEAVPVDDRASVFLETVSMLREAGYDIDEEYLFTDENFTS